MSARLGMPQQIYGGEEIARRQGLLGAGQVVGKSAVDQIPGRSG